MSKQSRAEKDVLKLPTQYRPAPPYTDALDDLYIRIRNLINFTGEVIVSRELSKKKIKNDLEVEPSLILNHWSNKKVEFPTIKVSANEWNNLIKRLSEHLFYTSVTQLATIYEKYLSEIFHEILWRHPELIIVGEKQLTTEEIFQYESLKEIRFALVDRKVNNLLTGSYPNMTKAISSLFKVEFHGSKSPMSLFEVHDFFEVRNVIVHNDGTAKEIYFNRLEGYGQETYIKDIKKKKGYVEIDFNWFFDNALKFLDQCSFIDELLTKKWKTSKGEK